MGKKKSTTAKKKKSQAQNRGSKATKVKSENNKYRPNRAVSRLYKTALDTQQYNNQLVLMRQSSFPPTDTKPKCFTYASIAPLTWAAYIYDPQFNVVESDKNDDDLTLADHDGDSPLTDTIELCSILEDNMDGLPNALLDLNLTETKTTNDYFPSLLLPIEQGPEYDSSCQEVCDLHEFKNSDSHAKVMASMMEKEFIRYFDTTFY
ncbi:hypothetical protein BC941DRAFT_467171 [Chlamydoabsidia padenii]|nr:hypothetical protein BC941DRAFT_467171 [Chlamydoabsidia padenii]